MRDQREEERPAAQEGLVVGLDGVRRQSRQQRAQQLSLASGPLQEGARGGRDGGVGAHRFGGGRNCGLRRRGESDGRFPEGTGSRAEVLPPGRPERSEARSAKPVRNNFAT